MMPNFIRTSALVGVALSVIGLASMALAGKQTSEVQQPTAAAAHRSPTCLAISPDGKTLYATDHTAGAVVVLDMVDRVKLGEIPLQGKPHGAALSADGSTLYVAEHGAGSVAVIDTAQGTVMTRISVGKWPTALAVSNHANRVYVCNQDRHSVSVIDLTQAMGRTVKEIDVVREPSCVAITPDERHIVVTNLLPRGAGTDPTLAAEVSIIDAASLTVSNTVKLPPGSTVVNGVCASPEGQWAYVVHGLGRFNLPITQLERGWVNTYALTILDVLKGKRLVTVLLDDLTQGAADPHTVVCSQDGMRLWISHAGVHEISVIDIGRVHELLRGNVPEELAALKDGNQPNIWVRIQRHRHTIAELENDLTALYIAGVIRRVPSGGNGPRGIVLAPDEKTLLAANYYSGCVAVLSADDGRLHGTIPLGCQANPDAARRGEIIFHDATHAFQRWHSCATCHPNQGRVDALRWDFLRDGMGNAKDTPSLVFVHKTEPLNRRATRKDARECARTGLLTSHLIVPTETVVEDLLAYLVSLRPEPSPHLLANGQLNEAAQRGRALFEGKARCAGCHPAPYYTDKQMHHVGVLSHGEPDGRYDTPSLIEVHRTAPYLHDGRAVTLRDVLTEHNEQGKHGHSKGLSDDEIDDVVAYLKSL